MPERIAKPCTCKLKRPGVLPQKERAGLLLLHVWWVQFTASVGKLLYDENEQKSYCLFSQSSNV